MNSVNQNSYRLLKLVNNLIDITRIDTGYYDINLKNHNIVSVIEDITLSVAQYIGDKGINLVFDTEIEEIIIACDEDKIEGIMLNLLSNAIKYTGEKGEIYVDLKVEMNEGVISVNSISGKYTKFILSIPIRTINNEHEIKIMDTTITSKIERCNVEFSDIYKDFSKKINYKQFM